MIEEGLIKFTNKDSHKIVNKLFNFYSKNVVSEWESKVIKDINELFIEYEVKDFIVNENSYMGIVIDCTLTNNNSIYIKVVPPMTNRFKTEVESLKLFSKKTTCKIYEVDYEKSIIIMEKIVPGTLVEFYDNKDKIRDFFREIYNNKVELTDEIELEFKNFDEVVEHDYLICKETPLFNEEVESLYNQFLKTYNEILNNNDRFLLHGDIYKNNLLLSENGLKMIDPLGFKAPFVMELVSICAYEMFYNPNNNIDILNDFINYFSCYVDSETYKKALFCNLVKVYIPSIYEANDGGIRANKWLEIIKELF